VTVKLGDGTGKGAECAAASASFVAVPRETKAESVKVSAPA
jgi:hypothetical protein